MRLKPLRRAPLAEVRRRAADADLPRPFLAGLRGPRIRLIAEVKGVPPSAGTIRPAFDPAEIARRYEVATGVKGAHSMINQSPKH